MSEELRNPPPEEGNLRREILRHYHRPGLSADILRALEKSGTVSDSADPSDFWPVDQFHIGGPRETTSLAELMGIEAGMHVFDAGGGLGGSARLLASRMGCRVEVLDLSTDYCIAGRDLTRRARLEHLVRFHRGNALQLPFRDGAFDAVLLQHCSMNIADKVALSREIHRVLRPGGRLGLHEVARGNIAPLHYPLPWARYAGVSFLRSPEELRDVFAAAGFTILHWNNITARSREWLGKRVSVMQSDQAPPALGLHLLLGPDVKKMLENQISNIDEGTQLVLQAVCERGDSDVLER